MLRSELEDQTGGSWRAFEGCLSILQAAGALERPAQQEEGEAVVMDMQEQAGEQQAQQAGVQPQAGQQQPAAEEQQDMPAAAAAEGAAASSEGGRAGTRIGFSALGLVAREVNCANELWMAFVLTHAAVQQLPPPLLAAVLSAGGWWGPGEVGWAGGLLRQRQLFNGGSMFWHPPGTCSAHCHTSRLTHQHSFSRCSCSGGPRVCVPPHRVDCLLCQ